MIFDTFSMALFQLQGLKKENPRNFEKSKSKDSVEIFRQLAGFENVNGWPVFGYLPRFLKYRGP